MNSPLSALALLEDSPRFGTARAEDDRWMREAIAWSWRGRGWTSPRPSVGCVLVRAGILLGGGHTQPGAGNPHAEIAALRAAKAAGHDARGATAYVTLEPCCHYATTPPCTLALLEAGVARVVCGVRDPNPLVDGGGFAQLQAAGVEVVAPFMARECFEAQEDFLFHITQRRPFVTLKLAASLDGKIALPSGESKWITGDVARRQAHVLRHQHDAVLVGANTVLADDPQLSVRLDGDWKQPSRLVVSSQGEVPVEARVFDGAGPDSVYLLTTDAISEVAAAQFHEAGVQVIRATGDDGLVDLGGAMDALYERGINSVLIEGGARITGAALRAGIVNKVAAFIAPVIIGAGREAVAGVELNQLADAFRLRFARSEAFGEDVLMTGYVG